jgi:hypothetical protein
MALPTLNPTARRVRTAEPAALPLGRLLKWARSSRQAAVAALAWVAKQNSHQAWMTNLWTRRNQSAAASTMRLSARITCREACCVLEHSLRPTVTVAVNKQR